MAFTQIFYHIVFSTKERMPVLVPERRDDLFRYIWGVIKNNKSHLYRINGVEDHVHIFTSLHPTVCLAELIKDLKVASNEWIKEQKAFPGFTNWQDSYGAFTHANYDKDHIIEYIKNQQEHHKKESFKDEFRRLLIEAEIEFDEKYLG